MATTTTEAKEKLTREQIRERVFKSREQKSEIIEFMGVDIEIRQPRLRDIVDIGEAVNDEVRNSVILNALVRYAYVPGTDELIFDEADVEGFKSLPYGEDFNRVVTAMGRLTAVNFPERNNT